MGGGPGSAGQFHCWSSGCHSGKAPHASLLLALAATSLVSETESSDDEAQVKIVAICPHKCYIFYGGCFLSVENL